jgi:phosphoglycerate kinase
MIGRAGDRLVLPVGAVVGPRLAAGITSQVVRRDQVPPGWAVFDIDPRSVRLFAEHILGAGTVLWNGPMGVFETPPFNQGTLGIAMSMAEATGRGAITIVGGGDSGAAIAQAGLADQVTHVSTGGGAALEFLEGRTLPGVAALDDAS